jgi:WhiB family redox-sensing transcriptional regulator
MTWRSRAACLDENPELFFPIGNADPAFHQVKRAKVVCRRCEVVDTCLRWAMQSHQDDGVWGGLSVKNGTPSNAATPETVALAWLRPFFDGSVGPDPGLAESYARRCALVGPDCWPTIWALASRPRPESGGVGACRRGRPRSSSSLSPACPTAPARARGR